MGKRLLWWVAMPVAAVGLIFAGRWVVASQGAQAHEQQRTHVQTSQATIDSNQEKRDYVLEVIGLGVTLDRFRQDSLWEALQNGGAYTTIREQDPKKYAWSASEKSGIEGGRQGHSLENGAKNTPMYWGVPVFNAVAPIYDANMADKPDDPRIGLAGSAVSSGMAWHLFVAGPRREVSEVLCAEVGLKNLRVVRW